jgi:hypothetical protein
MTLKKFSRKQVFNRRARLFSALAPYINTVIAGDLIRGAVSDLLVALPPAVSQNAVFESVRAIAGTTLSQKTAARLAWRLAGNIDRLIDGFSVVPWRSQVEDEVVPICVESVVPTRRRDCHGYVLYCRALAGSPAAELIPQFFTANSLRAISRVVGFSPNTRGSLQYAGVAQHFVNLMFFAHVEAERSRERPAFHNVSVSSGMLKANKELLAVRCRTEPCPDNFEHFCTNCFKGYTDCRFATHLKTYNEAHCKTCDSVSFFDPEGPGLICVNCSRATQHVSQ